jgi:PPK2 family polyphosphate:nucleotide phosphotransferase
MAIRFRDLANRYRVTRGAKFRLKQFKPGDTWKLKKESGQQLLAQTLDRLTELQGKLYAQNNYSLLLIFQAMDAAGKDSTIKHVMSGLNPQGCEVYSFKAPSNEELDHDFLWRAHRRLPERGRIGIFNRSYYEEVLVVRVHGELLEKQKLPPSVISKNIWRERFEDIGVFERYLTRNGTVIRKFFLNVSQEEQKKRFLDRLEQPEKNWKFSPDDLRERACWPDYMNAYEKMIQHTATETAPWYIVPADHKWFMRLVVASAIIETLESLGLKFPQVDSAKKKEFTAARRALLKMK